jgi:predicted small lipoprotein YifL
MKRLIFACLAVAALVSLSACTTSNNGQRAPIYHPDPESVPDYHPEPESGPDNSSVPIAFDPDHGTIQQPW